MQKEEAKKLLLRYSAGTCTEAEKALVEQHYLSYSESEPALSDERITALAKEIYANLPDQHPPVINLWPRRLKIAAVFVLMALASALLYYKTDRFPADDNTRVSLVSSSKIMLTLANGKMINITDAKNGVLSSEDGLEIVKTKRDEVVYRAIGPSSGELASSFNSIAIPKGMQCKITLSDGSKVWLNAASFLKYPATFPLSKVRKVMLSGEAYFEISKIKGRQSSDSQVYFVVQSKHQQVEVLGTRFNIDAYKEDSFITTTLLSGSVRVSTSGTVTKQFKREVLLKPNQQSVLSANGIKLDEVDPEEAIAWKDGEFMFRNEPLQNIMKEISRWYDIDVVYEDSLVGNERFGGTISQAEHLKEVLKMLELTGDVHFRIEGRRVFVTK